MPLKPRERSMMATKVEISKIPGQIIRKRVTDFFPKQFNSAAVFQDNTA